MPKGMLLTLNKEGEEGRFQPDHPAADFAKYLKEQGCEIQPRAMGFKVTDGDGGRLGFVTIKKEGFAVYLTTIPADHDVLNGVEHRKGNSGLAVIEDVGTNKQTLAALRSIYSDKAEWDEANKETKPKKPKKKKAKAEDEAAEDKPKTKRRKKKKGKKPAADAA
jgi:hypothetical protein